MILEASRGFFTRHAWKRITPCRLCRGADPLARARALVQRAERDWHRLSPILSSGDANRNGLGGVGHPVQHRHGDCGFALLAGQSVGAQLGTDQACPSAWRNRRGRVARWPELVEATRLRTTRVVFAAAHLHSDPTNNRLRNLRALCQRCHMLHDLRTTFRSGGSPTGGVGPWPTYFLASTRRCSKTQKSRPKAALQSR